MIKQRPYMLMIPAKIAELFPTWAAGPPFKSFNLDHAKLLLSIIRTHQRKDDNDNVHARLVMEYLRNIVFNAHKYIEYFIQIDAIERVGGYTPGKESYKYRYKDPYKDSFIWEPLRNMKLYNRIKKVHASRGRKQLRPYPKQSAVIRKIRINIDNAKRLAHANCEGDSLVYGLGAAARIANKEFYCKTDDTGRRLHTNLTNLPKYLRGEITIDGKHLSGVDIRNSQPYMAGKVLDDPESIEQFYPGKLPLMKFLCLRLHEQQDVTAFHLLTSEAKFYNFLLNAFNDAGLSYDLDSVKTKCFQILFDKDRHRSKEKDIFTQHFPSLAKVASIMKSGDYKNFVITLQRIESHVVLDRIIKRLNTEYPDMIATPIYDSVCTSIATDDIKTVARVMREELTAFIGRPPALKTETYTTTQRTKSKQGKAGREPGQGNHRTNMMLKCASSDELMGVSRVHTSEDCFLK